MNTTVFHSASVVYQRRSRIERPGALLVAGDQLGARGEALGAGDLAEVLAQSSFQGRPSRSTSCTDSRGPPTGRRSSPSPSRAPHQPVPGPRRENRVAEAVVAVHDRGRPRGGQVLGQPDLPTRSTAGISRVLLSSQRPRKRAAGVRGSRSASEVLQARACQSTPWISTSASISCSPIARSLRRCPAPGTLETMTSPSTRSINRTAHRSLECQHKPRAPRHARGRVLSARADWPRAARRGRWEAGAGGVGGAEPAGSHARG